MYLIQVGDRFLNLDQLIQADILRDENGAIRLRTETNIGRAVEWSAEDSAALLPYLIDAASRRPPPERPLIGNFRTEPPAEPEEGEERAKG
jgi:hypothetical protein